MFLINLSNVIDIWEIAALFGKCSFSGHVTEDFGPKLQNYLCLPKQYIVYPGFEFYHSVQPKKYKTI
jgi:hypothetical protein